MGLFNRPKKNKRITELMIQMTSPEAAVRDVYLESMLTGRSLNVSVPGTTNAYTSYESQVAETYRKYNSQSDFGNQQTRAVVDLRTAFIAGEGVTVSAPNARTAKWIEDFISVNKLNGFNFLNAVKGTEMMGQAYMTLKPFFSKALNKNQIKLSRLPYRLGRSIRPIYRSEFKEEVIDVQQTTDFGWESLGYNNFIYVRTGGDDGNNYGPVTKIGVVLTDLENYDRALRDMRRTNHVTARVTPVFKTKSDAETTALKAWLTNMRWTIGKAFIGSSEFSYESPDKGAHENLIAEMTATIKTISATTGVPVHWLGYVDLMSNRSTADSLYEFIKNATILERSIWEEAMYDTILKGQELYIDSGNTDLTYDTNFQVRLPLISFENFLEKVRALSQALADEAISIDDYRNCIPGIDPLKTKKAIEKQKKEEEKNLIKMGLPMLNKGNSLNNNQEDSEDENNNSD